MGLMTNQIKRRLASLERREDDPLVLRWLFPPNGVPRSQVKFTWIKEGVDEA
jgi:hypothetical protein